MIGGEYFLADVHSKITEDEQAAIKHDLLIFIHCVCDGYFHSPEHIKALVPVVETVAKFFD